MFRDKNVVSPLQRQKNVIAMGKLAGKDQLTDQAIALFRAKGYSATSVDEIVRACGITKGSLYHHFRGKEDLAIAAIDRVHRYFAEEIFSIVMSVERPGIAELTAFNHAVEAFFVMHPDGCLLANLSIEIGMSHDLFKERIRRFFADWRNCYAKTFTLEGSQLCAATVAEDAVAIVHGCILMHRIDGRVEPLRRQHQKLIDLLRDEVIALRQTVSEYAPAAPSSV